MPTIQYNNGNYTVIFDTKNGTKIRATADDDFVADFPENIDIKITNWCNMGCKFCHEGSNAAGQHGNILNYKFIETLHPGTELAIGGGLVTSHPDLEAFLRKLKRQGIIANITVHQHELLQNMDKITHWLNEGLVHGVGISLHTMDNQVVQFAQEHPSCVIHLICGVTTALLDELADKGLKVLLLGYKTFGRGVDYAEKTGSCIQAKINTLTSKLPEMLNKFAAISFDNLAIKQVQLQDIIPDEFETVYMGDDGLFTCYMDLVEGTFAMNSTTPKEDRFPIEDDIYSMFAKVKAYKRSRDLKMI